MEITHTLLKDSTWLKKSLALSASKPTVPDSVFNAKAVDNHVEMPAQSLQAMMMSKLSKINQGIQLPTELFRANDLESTVSTIGQKAGSLEVEVAHIINDKDVLVSSTMASPDRVNIPVSLIRQAKGGTIVHNHPNASTKLGENSFSPEDLLTAIEADARETVVFSNNIKYSIKFKKGYDKSQLKTIVSDINEKWDYNDNNFGHNHWNKLSTEGYFEYSASHFDRPALYDKYIADAQRKILTEREALKTRMQQSVDSLFDMLK